jgi:hypothetical protein
MVGNLDEIEMLIENFVKTLRNRSNFTFETVLFEHLLASLHDVPVDIDHGNVLDGLVLADLIPHQKKLEKLNCNAVFDAFVTFELNF